MEPYLAHPVFVTHFRALRITIAVLLALAFIETPSSFTYVRLFFRQHYDVMGKFFDPVSRPEEIVETGDEWVRA